MPKAFRLILDTERPLSTSEGLSVDDTLPIAIDTLGSDPILHLYTFVPSAIVGRYQDLQAALKLDRCEALGIEYNRRSTGGGTVIMGPSVIALGFGINVDYPGLRPGVSGVFDSLSKALIIGLKGLGIDAYFRPKNDLEVKGKKIAGLSAAMETGKSLLFHTSLLVDFDMFVLTEIMNTPLIKIKDKGYSCFSERLTTVNREGKREFTVKEVMEAIVRGFEEHFGVELIPERLSPEEEKISLDLKKKRYENPEWIYSHKHPRVRMGCGAIKTPGGLLEIYLSLAGPVIESIYITGDFFTTTKKLALIESSLKYKACNEESLKDALGKIWEPDIIYNVTQDQLIGAIMLAKENQIRI